MAHKKEVKFSCKYHNYIKYVKTKDGEIKVQFKNGIYETDNDDVIEALKKDNYVKEIK